MVKTHSDSKFRHVAVLFNYGYSLTTQSHPYPPFYLDI